MAVQQISQQQVPDGMVMNLPWGTDVERWTDKMVERGLKYLRGDLDKGPDGEGHTFFPTLLDRMEDQAEQRGLVV